MPVRPLDVKLCSRPYKYGDSTGAVEQITSTSEVHGGGESVGKGGGTGGFVSKSGARLEGLQIDGQGEELVGCEGIVLYGVQGRFRHWR
jgi:hypothetical protein